MRSPAPRPDSAPPPTRRMRPLCDAACGRHRRTCVRARADSHAHASPRADRRAGQARYVRRGRRRRAIDARCIAAASARPCRAGADPRRTCARRRWWWGECHPIVGGTWIRGRRAATRLRSAPAVLRRLVAVSRDVAVAAIASSAPRSRSERSTTDAQRRRGGGHVTRRGGDVAPRGGAVATSARSARAPSAAAPQSSARAAARSARTTRAGRPTATLSGGTSSRTTALAPMRARAPMRTGPRIRAPAPIQTSSPIVG